MGRVVCIRAAGKQVYRAEDVGKMHRRPGLSRFMPRLERASPVTVMWWTLVGHRTGVDKLHIASQISMASEG